MFKQINKYIINFKVTLNVYLNIWVYTYIYITTSTYQFKIKFTIVYILKILMHGAHKI